MNWPKCPLSGHNPSFTIYLVNPYIFGSLEFLLCLSQLIFYLFLVLKVSLNSTSHGPKIILFITRRFGVLHLPPITINQAHLKQIKRDKNKQNKVISHTHPKPAETSPWTQTPFIAAQTCWTQTQSCMSPRAAYQISTLTFLLTSIPSLTHSNGH